VGSSLLSTEEEVVDHGELGRVVRRLFDDGERVLGSGVGVSGLGRGLELVDGVVDLLDAGLEDRVWKRAAKKASAFVFELGQRDRGEQLTDDLVELLSVVQDEGIDLSREGVVDLGGVLRRKKIDAKSENESVLVPGTQCFFPLL